MFGSPKIFAAILLDWVSYSMLYWFLIDYFGCFCFVASDGLSSVLAWGLPDFKTFRLTAPRRR